MLMSASRRSTSSPALRTRRLGMFALRRTGWGQRTPRTPQPRLRVALLLRCCPGFGFSPAPQFAQPNAAHAESPAGAPGPGPPLVYTSIPVDRFRLDIRVLALRLLLPLALGLLVLLLLSQPARATSHRVQASPQPFRLLTSQGTAGTQPTRSLSRRTCSHRAHHRFPAIVRDRRIHRSVSSRTSSLPRWFPR
jgi:hypothetical protein